MLFSRYLYSKVNSSDSEFEDLVLNEDEMRFLDVNEVDFHPNNTTDSYHVNCEQLRELFCH